MKLKIKSIDVREIDRMLNKNAEAARKVLKYTTSDLRSRVPTQVAKAATQVYNIDKKEIKYSKKNSARKAGTLKRYGKTIDDLQFVYVGRPLSYVRFGIDPEKPPKPEFDSKGKRIPQPISAKVRKKGARRKLKKQAFFAPTGSKKEGGYNNIPFIRKTKKAYPIMPLKTVSLPHMIAKDEVSEDLNAKIKDLVEKRLAKHIKTFMQKP